MKSLITRVKKVPRGLFLMPRESPIADKCLAWYRLDVFSMSAFKNKKWLILKKFQRVRAFYDLKVLKVQIFSDKKMDAHVQKQTYYQLRGTSWKIGMGW